MRGGAGLSRHLGVAVELDRNPDHFAAWRRDDLAFSQTCGYPFTHEFKGLLKYIATPHYAVPGCHGANYCSFIFARFDQPLDSFRGGVAAVNNPDSMSGMLALETGFRALCHERGSSSPGRWKAAATSSP